MAQKTFIANNLFNEFTLFHPEIPLTALAGQPDLYEVGAAWVLWNQPDSNQLIRMKNIKIINQMSNSSTLGTASLNINYISAYVESDMTETMANITPMDSNNPALPSQIYIKSRLNSVTTTSTIRSLMNMASNLNTRTIPLRCSKNYGKFDTTLVFNQLTDNQGIVLNEGQGIAIVPSGIQSNIAYRITITFLSGTHTWMAGETIRPFAEMIPCVVFNNTGSGVVLKILSISFYEIGEDNIPYFAIQKIDGVQPELKSIDLTSTVLSMDSNNTLSSGIKVYEDCIVNIYGSKYGATIANPSYRRQMPMWLGVNPSMSVVRMYGLAASQEITDSEIVIRPGEGLALMQKNNSGMGRYGASILFNTEDLTTGSTGSGGGAFAFSYIGD